MRVSVSKLLVVASLALSLLLSPMAAWAGVTTDTVQPGDTLSIIAARHGTSTDAILAANPSITDPNLIYVGQTIVIPGPDGQQAVVQSTSATLSATSAGGENGAVLGSNLLVTWYGNPHDPRMGALGQYSGADLAARVRRQANAYAPYTDKNIMPAYELIAVVAQGSPGPDGMWRSRESAGTIDSMLQQARANGFKLVLDVQVGQSTVQDELAYLMPWLKQPDVYLALDPEFDMWKGQTPGVQIGHMTSGEVNYALNLLTQIVRQNNLPPKVLIVHQFTENMLPDKQNIGRSPVVDLVLDMDGFGAQWLKLDSYNMVMTQGQLEFAGIKLFYDQDPGMFTPKDALGLKPRPSVIIYQ